MPWDSVRGTKLQGSFRGPFWEYRALLQCRRALLLGPVTAILECHRVLLIHLKQFVRVYTNTGGRFLVFQHQISHPIISVTQAPPNYQTFSLMFAQNNCSIDALFPIAADHNRKKESNSNRMIVYGKRKGVSFENQSSSSSRAPNICTRVPLIFTIVGHVYVRRPV